MRSLLDGLIGVCLAVALGACSERSEPHASSADAARPNLLVIVADDLGYGDLGCYGAPHAITPQLDALAADGVRFEHFYVASPMCSSSRASLLTGRYPGRHGLTQALVGDDPDAGLDPREVLLPERLRDVGYATGLVGKWHLGLRPEHHPLARGFDEFFGMLAASSGYYEHAYRGTPDLWRGREAVTSERYSTELFSDEAVAFVERHAREPWMLWLAYNAPHLADDRRSLPAPERWREAYADAPLSDVRRDYLAVVSALDEGVGRVLDALERLDLSDDTLVVFLSDNGPLPRHDATGPLVGGKDTLAEGGLRVPLIARWPGRWPRGVASERPTSAMDVTATLLEAAGASPPRGRTVDGAPIDDPTAGGEALFFDHTSRHVDARGRRLRERVVRAGRWRLTRTHDGRRVLHDVLADPGQARDVAAEHPDVVARLDALLADFAADVGGGR